LQLEEDCSISIDYDNGSSQWHIDYHGTRLNVLASTSKVVHLMAYADAVAAHQIDPSNLIPASQKQDNLQFEINPAH
jgi:beta-lactamase class A